MLFLMELGEEQRRKFFSTVIACLLDFNELNPATPVAIFLQVGQILYAHSSWYVLNNNQKNKLK